MENPRDVFGLSPTELENDLRRSEKILKEAELQYQRRRLENGIKHFVPNQPQLKALQSKARIVAYVGGNRAGKSTAGAAFLSAHLSGHYPSCECHGEWFSVSKRHKRPLKALIVATSFQKIEEVIEPKLMTLLPHELIYHVKRGQLSYLRSIRLRDGSLISCLTGDQDEMEFESADWDIVWIDEPLSKSRFNAIMRGLIDRQGIMILTFTPKIEPWMKETFLDKADGKFIEVVEADTYQNTEDIHGKSILSKESIQEFEKSLPDDERQTRIHGKFFFLRGIVYKEFSDTHLKDFEYEYPNPVICVLDPHDRRPHHVIWAFVDREDDVFIDLELEIHCELDELARKLREIERERGYKMRRRLIDPNFGRKPASVGTNLSVIQELARHGTGFYESNDNIELGHMIVRDYLHWDSSKPETAVNKPKLFFSRDRTPRTIRSIRNYQYGEWKGAAKDERDPKERFKDKDTHGADCIRYLLVGRPTFQRLSEQASYELEESPY